MEEGQLELKTTVVRINSSLMDIFTLNGIQGCTLFTDHSKLELRLCQKSLPNNSEASVSSRNEEYFRCDIDTGISAFIGQLFTISLIRIF